jgi:hypothetical protein
MRERKHLSIIERRQLHQPRYEVRRTWKFGSRRHVVALPEDWAGIQYVLLRHDEDGIIIYPLEGIKDDSEAAQIALNLNKQLKGGEHD